jgi:hypothetical protein
MYIIAGVTNRAAPNGAVARPAAVRPLRMRLRRWLARLRRRRAARQQAMLVERLGHPGVLVDFRCAELSRQVRTARAIPLTADLSAMLAASRRD